MPVLIWIVLVIAWFVATIKHDPNTLTLGAIFLAYTGIMAGLARVQNAIIAQLRHHKLNVESEADNS